jgi:hypothetical protein
MDNVLSRTALMEHILSLVEDPESHVKELGAILEWDPSLSTSVTRKAASSYGLSIPACTLNLALALLGSRVVKETVKFAITSRASHDLVFSIYETDGVWNRMASSEHESGPVPEILCGALKEQLETGLGLLSPEMRVVLALFYYESLPPEMIARVTGIDAEEVERLKDQALRRLGTVFGPSRTDQLEGPGQ